MTQDLITLLIGCATLHKRLDTDYISSLLEIESQGPQATSIVIPTIGIRQGLTTGRRSAKTINKVILCKDLEVSKREHGVKTVSKAIQAKEIASRQREHSSEPLLCQEEDVVEEEVRIPLEEEEQVASTGADLNRRPKARKHSKTILTILDHRSKQATTIRSPSS